MRFRSLVPHVNTSHEGKHAYFPARKYARRRKALMAQWSPTAFAVLPDGAGVMCAIV